MSHKVTVNFNDVELPNGFYYNATNAVVLTDDQFALINPAAFVTTIAGNGINGVATNSSATLLTDNGVQGPSGLQVTTQGAAVTLTSVAPSALTSSQSATSSVATTSPTNSSPYGYASSAQAAAIITLANALQVSYNALQVDVAALKVVIAELVVDVAALNTNLSGSGKALA